MSSRHPDCEEDTNFRIDPEELKCLEICLEEARKLWRKEFGEIPILDPQAIVQERKEIFELAWRMYDSQQFVMEDDI